MKKNYRWVPVPNNILMILSYLKNGEVFNPNGNVGCKLLIQKFSLFYSVYMVTTTKIFYRLDLYCN